MSHLFLLKEKILSLAFDSSPKNPSIELQNNGPDSGQESCYDQMSFQQKLFSKKGPEKALKTAPKSTGVFFSEREGKSSSPHLPREESVQIYQKLMRISSQSNADEPLSSLKIKSKSIFEKEFMVVSEEEFYEINNVERNNVGYLINDYFDINFDKDSLMTKKREMKKEAERLHLEHRARIHEFYEKARCSEPNQKIYKHSRSVCNWTKCELGTNKPPDWFSKYDLNFIHMDLILNEKSPRNKQREESFLNSLDEEKCLKKIMKIYKDNKMRFWIDNHHYNRMINRPSKEKIHKPCCRKAEYGGAECHPVKYSLMTFYKFLEETLKDLKIFGRLWILTYDYYFNPENFLFEIIKMFFIPIPLFLSKEEQKKFMNFKTLPKQKKILNFLRLWIETRPEDFSFYKNLGLLLKAFLAIIDLIYKGLFKEEVSYLKKKVIMDTIRTGSIVPSIKKMKEEDQILLIPVFENGKQNKCYVIDLEMPPTLISHESAIFFSIDSEALVQQFCLIDYQMYKDVKPHILCNNFKSPMNSSILNKIIKRYNFFTYYFILTIILQKDNAEKVKIILKFLEIAEKCEKFQNYQCLMTVCNALSHLLVLRYKKVWEALPPASKKVDERIKDLVCFNKNYKKLRKTMKECKPPFIPCLNIILRDINQLDGDNEWIFLKDKEFLNLKKMEALYEINQHLSLVQKHQYNFEKRPFFYDFFESRYQKILEYYFESNKFECIEEKLFEISKNIESSSKI